MKKKLKYFFVLLNVALSANQVSAQTNKADDSLLKILSTAKNDTARINRLNDISLFLINTTRYSNADSFAAVALQESGTINYKKGYGRALANLAFVSNKLGDYTKSINCYSKAIKVYEELGDSLDFAHMLNRIGDDYWAIGNYPMALEKEFKAQQIFDRYNNKYGESVAYLSLGNIFGDLGDNDNAIKYYTIGLKISIEINEKDDIAAFWGDIGDSYQFEKKFREATEYSMKALKLNAELGDKEGMVDNINNLGDICFQQNNDTGAIRYYLTGLSISEDIESKQRIADNLVDLGKTYLSENKISKALEYANRGTLLSKQIGTLIDIRDGEQTLARIYEDMHNIPEAYQHYKAYITIRDTLSNQDNTRKMTRTEMGLEYEKRQALAKAEQDKKDVIELSDKRKQKIITWSVLGGLLLVLIFAGFIFRSLRLTRKQKQNIESKNKVIEEKNKDILDSITYAKRLQDAILPPLSIIKQYFPESFLLYKPKDIVAGDFYWMERAGDTILIAAADCTGHGVPGALVSVVCSNALNRTVKEFRITEPGKILDKVCELVLETFEKSENNVQDGMDISLCCINTKTNEIQWSGAYNSLWYIQNKQIHEVSADKQPIGKHDKPQPFSTHILNLQKGDTLYLFTDGYADQFGGPQGKKFKYKKLHDLIFANISKPMEEQKTILKNILDEWKGNLEQVDDILVIGIKI